jgi:hypothetical protein
MDDYSREIRREARLANKLLRLGTDQPFCIYCGMTDCRCLVRPKEPNSMLRCRNCDAKRRPISDETLARKRAAFEAAKYPNPACVACDESDLRALELDHLAGAANSRIVEPLCLNCHAIKSDDAEDEPVASLRLRDPNRVGLVLQAAFEFGAAAVLTLIAAQDGDDAGARAIFLFALAAILIAWAFWNLSTHEDLTVAYGADYGRVIQAKPPQ